MGPRPEKVAASEIPGGSAPPAGSLHHDRELASLPLSGASVTREIDLSRVDEIAE